MHRPERRLARSRSIAARPLLSLAIPLLLAATPQAAAQLAPAGPELQVNTLSTGLYPDPRVETTGPDDFVVTWYQWDGPSWLDEELVGRRFGPGGAPAGAEFQISDSSPNPFPTRLAVDPTGALVLAWGAGASGPGPGDPDEVHARRFAADGTPLGAQFQVNTTPGTEYTYLSGLAMRSGGDFVVAWDNYGAFLRRFDDAGLPLSGEIALSLPGESIDAPQIVEDSNGDLLAIWESAFDLRGARFDVAGTPTGAPFPVATHESGLQYPGDLALLDDGSSVVVWTSSESPGDDDSGWSVQARRFDAAGLPQGDQFQVNSYVAGDQISPQITADGSGGFVVVWASEESGGGDTSAFSVQARRFAADGTALGREIQVNTSTEGDQYAPDVAADGSGAIAVTWMSRLPGVPPARSVLTRRYRLALFSDGFESGDTGRWSATQP